MSEKTTSWQQLRAKRMAAPEARQGYEDAQLAFTLGAKVRTLREDRGWSQTELARQAAMTQSAVARFEAGGTIPTLPLLHRLARALDANLVVTIDPEPTDAPQKTPARHAPPAKKAS